MRLNYSKKLDGEGLFAMERKRALPRFPERIALITSRDAAAYGDFLKVLKARRGGLTIYFIHTAVQGKDAPGDIINALARANTAAEAIDAIVMVRGGGSMEDLQAFNDERVVRAVAASRLPTIVGIGHERDITLAELAADQRASTPSNAAELLTQTRVELEAALGYLTERLRSAVHSRLQAEQGQVVQALQTLRHHFAQTSDDVRAVIARLGGLQHRLRQKVAADRQQVSGAERILRRRMQENLTGWHTKQHQLIRLFKSFSPETILHRGYSITRLNNGRVLKRVSDVAAGDVLHTQLSDGQVQSTVGEHVISQLELGL